MTRLLTLVVLALALVSTQVEARSKRIHVTAEVTQQTFTGEPTNPPQLGDRSITSVDLFDENHTKVGTGAGFCTIVSLPPLEARVQCLLSVEFAEGQIIFGGLAPLPEVGVVAQFGILGGTEKFRKARGVVTIAVLTPELLQDATFELE
jgi:Allene oxide cyclase barrel like domain